MKKDKYKVITDNIISGLEQVAEGKDKIPAWIKPWANIGAIRNAFSNRQYNGINAFSLALKMGVENWNDPRFATFNQIRKEGGMVKKGEKSTAIILWSPKNILDKKTRKDKLIFFSKMYSVFNVKAQTIGIELKKTELSNKDERNEKLDKMFKNVGVNVTHGGDRAVYNITQDNITMPDFNRFTSSDDYYSVLSHETTHWTGSEKRLNRNIKNKFGSNDYAFEELVAELGSAFIGQDLGINGKFQDNHLAYIKSWIYLLKKDNKAIFRASSLARQAVNFIYEKEKTETAEVETITN